MRLWTFQHISAVEQLEKTGQLVSTWKDETSRWYQAYQWMVKEMRTRGVDCGTNNPMWAWHSCGGYKKPPTLEDAAMLLSIKDIEDGIKIVEFECPDSLAILSLYSIWNEILEVFFKGGTKDDITEKWTQQLFSFEPDVLEEDEDALQACLPHIRLDWVVRISELPLKIDKRTGWELEPYEPGQLA